MSIGKMTAVGIVFFFSGKGLLVPPSYGRVLDDGTPSLQVFPRRHPARTVR
jgi:hypothetical protein